MDSEQMQEMYERYGYAVYRRCLRLLGDSAMADDALQEVFLRVLARISLRPHVSG